LEDVELQNILDAEEEAEVADPPTANLKTYEGLALPFN
jgi:hypothetical protein